ncbi:MAG: spermidine synthase [Pseudomonadota bacterium]
MASLSLSSSRALPDGRHVFLYGCLLLTGFAGLGYQSIWSRLFGAVLGHDFAAVIGVVTGFFVGLSLGALLLRQPLARSLRPGVWLAVFEAIIGLWSALLLAFWPWLSALVPLWVGAEPSAVWQWGLAMALPVVLLAPATMAMGATLPAADRFLCQLRAQGYGLGGVYGANTLGAVLGVLAITYWLCPLLGFQRAGVILCTLNLLAGSLLLLLARGQNRSLPAAFNGRTNWPVLGALIATGFLGIGYEIAAIRALSQLLENTVFTFAALLAVYLLATSIGAFVYAQSARLKALPNETWMALQAGACLLGVAGLWLARPVFQLALDLPLSPGVAAALGEMGAAAFVFMLPAVVMGAVFTHLVSASRNEESGIGLGVGMNMLGSAAAPGVFGLLLLPVLGVLGTLTIIASGYLFLFPTLAVRRLWRPVCLGGAAALLVFSPLAPTLLFLEDGLTSLVRSEGVLGTVNVYADSADNRYLKVNNGFVMGGTVTKKADRRQGHIPLLLHPGPKRALFLGLGTGATFAAAAYHSGLEARAAELVPEIVDALPLFESVSGEIAALERLQVQTGDARRFVLASKDFYDVIVSDTFHPSRDGAGMLYTVEHFNAVKARLTPGGVFCQWLPLHQLDKPTFKLIVRSFVEAFPGALATLNDLSLETPVIGLLGGVQALRPDPDVVNAEMLVPALDQAGLAGVFGPLEGIIADAAGLNAYAGEGRLNTDDHPHVMFEAPQSVYNELGNAGARLIGILEALPLPSARSLVPVHAQRRLEAYWTARDAFLALGIDRNAAEETDERIRQLARPLLGVLQISPDFTPAYDPLLNMAAYLSKQNPTQAFALLQALERVAPQRREASMVLDTYFPGPRGNAP